MKRRKIISLFSGCGGLDIGFEQHGFEPVVCVDNDPEACKTLRQLEGSGTVSSEA